MSAKSIEIGLYHGSNKTWISGRGETEEEAMQALLRRLDASKLLHRAFSNGTKLPLDFLRENMPENPMKESHVFLILSRGGFDEKERVCWDRIFFLVPKGTSVEFREYGITETFAIGDEPTKIHQTKEFYGYRLTLPPGSVKLTDGSWIPCEVSEAPG